MKVGSYVPSVVVGLFFAFAAAIPPMISTAPAAPAQNHHFL